MAREISNFPASDTDWLNFIHFSGYKHKIRLVSRLRKRKDQALISISTILKFPALDFFKIDSINWQICLKLRCDKVKTKFLHYYLSRNVTPGRDKHWTSRWPEEQTANIGEHETTERGRIGRKHYIYVTFLYVNYIRIIYIQK